MWAESWAPMGGGAGSGSSPQVVWVQAGGADSKEAPSPKAVRGWRPRSGEAVTAVLGGKAGAGGSGRGRDTGGQEGRPRAGGRGWRGPGGAERRTVQWGSSLQAEGSRVLTPSALHL